MREYTNKLWDLIDNGALSAEEVLNACLSYMSEDEVEDMAKSNCFIDDDEEEDDDDDYELDEEEEKELLGDDEEEEDF